jgi:hypothetical protein
MYTFREIPLRSDISIDGGIIIGDNNVVVDVGAIAASPGLNTTAVKLHLTPDKGAQPMVYGMDVRVCYYPKCKYTDMLIQLCFTFHINDACIMSMDTLSCAFKLHQ